MTHTVGSDEFDDPNAEIAAELAAAMPTRHTAQGPPLEELQSLDSLSPIRQLDIAMMIVLAAPLPLIGTAAVGVAVPYLARFVVRVGVTLAGLQTAGLGFGPSLSRAVDLLSWLLALTITGSLLARPAADLWFGQLPEPGKRRAHIPLRTMLGLEAVIVLIAVPALIAFVPEWNGPWIAVAIAAGIVGVPLLAAALLGFTLAPVIAAAEGATTGAALRRSVRLGGATTAGQMLGSCAMSTMLVVPLALFLLEGRDQIVNWLHLGVGSIEAQAIRILLEYVVAVFSCTLVALLCVPAYLDARIRREGLDCELIFARMQAGR